MKITNYYITTLKLFQQNHKVIKTNSEMLVFCLHTKKTNKNKTKYVDFMFVWLYNLNIKSENAFLSFAKQKFSATYGYNFLFLLGDRL